VGNRIIEDGRRFREYVSGFLFTNKAEKGKKKN
jgi:hypothetical protein